MGLAMAAELKIIDDTGRTLVLGGPATRIVSLAPGATAMLFAAGGGSRVVGTVEYSDEPEAAKQIPRIGDSQSFDAERVLALHPDVVVAWEGGTSLASIEHLGRLGLKVYHHKLTRLDDLAPALEKLGALVGNPDQARQTAATLTTRLASLREQHATARGRVLIQVWDRPIYTVGGAQLLSDVLGLCGYTNLFEDLPEAGPSVSREAVLARNPDLILALAPDAATGQEWLQSWRTLPTMQAVMANRLVQSADQRLTRLGPSIVPAAEELCAQLDR